MIDSQVSESTRCEPSWLMAEIAIPPKIGQLLRLLSPPLTSWLAFAFRNECAPQPPAPPGDMAPRGSECYPLCYIDIPTPLSVGQQLHLLS